MFSRNFLSSNVFLSQFSKHLTGLLNKSFSPVVTFMNSFHKQHVCAACNNIRLVPQFGKYDCSSHLFFHFNFSLILLYLQLRCMYMLLPCILFPLPYGFKQNPTYCMLYLRILTFPKYSLRIQTFQTRNRNRIRNRKRSKNRNISSCWVD